MTILGIDPGTVCGMAIFNGGALTGLWSCSSVEMLHYLCEAELDQIILEDSRLQSHVWNAHGKQGRQALKVARNVGSVDRICTQIEEIAIKRSVRLLSLSPRVTGSKMRSKPFSELTGWNKRTNEHERDAAIAAWPYRNLVMASA